MKLIAGILFFSALIGLIRLAMRDRADSEAQENARLSKDHDHTP